MSIYTAKIVWKNDSGDDFEKNKYSRGHEWVFDGGVTVPASSSPYAVRVPYSLENAVDPEEAWVGSASSCHMLSFLWVAAKSALGIDLLAPEGYARSLAAALDVRHRTCA